MDAATVSVDFNAMTEAGHVRLLRWEEAELSRLGLLIPGTRLRVTDGELRVDAVLALDPYYGWVVKPAWETLVDLIDFVDDLPVEPTKA